jgi:PBSX family phage portal protein
MESKTELVEETIILDQEIDDISYMGFTSKVETFDPFDLVKIDSLSPKMKRKAVRLQKKHEGEDGTKSKYVDPEVVSGYSLYDIVNPPYDLDTLAGLYDQSAIHYAAINARVMNTVGLGYEFQETLKAKRRIEKAQAGEEKLTRLRQQYQDLKEDLDETFESLNIEETLIETMVRVWQDVLTVGNGYLEIGRNNAGKIGYIGHVPATLVRVRRKRDGYVQIAKTNKIQAVFFRQFQDKETPDPINNDPKPNELIHFKIYSPNNTYYGIPSAVSAATAIIGDKFAKEYNIDYFENKAIPRYAIILKGAKLSNKSKQELINYFRNEVKGRNHGTLVIPLPASLGSDTDIKFEKLEAGIQDSSFDKYRKSNRDEILVANRVPAPKVGVYDNANLAVSRDADKSFKMQVIGPDQAIIEKKLNRIVGEFTDLMQIHLKKIDLVDEDIQSRINDRYLRTEVITPNEVRSQIGLPERYDGDEVLPFPTNVKKEQNDSGKNGPGAPFGNDNNSASEPPKSPTGDGATSDPRADGAQAERGQNQDSGVNNDSTSKFNQGEYNE